MDTALGASYLNGGELGGTLTTFLKENSHCIWEEYTAAKYEIVESSAERRALRFRGMADDGERNQTSN
jgi:hypothetical protein